MIVWLLTDASGCAGHAGNQDRTRDNFIYLYGDRGPRHEDRHRRVEGAGTPLRIDILGGVSLLSVVVVDDEDK